MRHYNPNLIFAGATPIEYGFARLNGPSLYVGVRCRVQKPTLHVVSYGYAGSLTDDLPVGSVVTAKKVVDLQGKTLWEDEIVGPRNATAITVVSTDHIVNCPKEREQLRKDTNADVVDMESDIIARLGFFGGYARVISDTPSHPLFSVHILQNLAFASMTLLQITF